MVVGNLQIVFGMVVQVDRNILVEEVEMVVGVEVEVHNVVGLAVSVASVDLVVSVNSAVDGLVVSVASVVEVYGGDL